MKKQRYLSASEVRHRTDLSPLPVLCQSVREHPAAYSDQRTPTETPTYIMEQWMCFKSL